MKLPILLLLTLTLLLIAGCSSDLPPEPNAPGVTGNYYKAMGSWATEPNSFKVTPDMVYCNENDVVEINFESTGADYTYHQMFLWDDALGEWKERELSGKRAKSWIEGDAALTISTKCSDLAAIIDDDLEFYSVAYSCSKVGSAWNCNDNKWQLEVGRVEIDTFSCFDDDVENDPFVKGSISYNDGNMVYDVFDECKDSNAVTQYLCGDTSSESIESSCAYGCSDGACIATPDIPCLPGDVTCVSVPDPVLETCEDGIKNQDEDDVDCGGVCAACVMVADPTCTDGIKNQDETGVDCGGTCAACPSGEVSMEGLVAHYNFNEGAGATLTDVVNSNNGQIMGAEWAAGIQGGALLFDGVSDYVALPNDLGYTDKVSAFAWFKSLGDSEWNVVLGGNELELNIQQSTGNTIFSITTSSGKVHTYPSPNSANDGNWHLLGFTYDGTTKVNYIDGVEFSRQDVTGTLVSSFANRKIGQKGDESYFANGIIDEVMIFDRGLTSAEVTSIFNAEGTFN